MMGNPPTAEQRNACGNAKRWAEEAERALVRCAVHVGDAGMEQDPIVAEMVGDLVDEYLLLAAGKAVLPPPAPEPAAPSLPYTFADKVCREWRERRTWVPSTGSSVRTEADLATQLAYLEGFPEAQRAAREAFRQRQRRAAA